MDAKSGMMEWSTYPNTGDKHWKYECPNWAWIVVLLDAIIFLPIFFFCSYTLERIYPIFAIIEDENPPLYEQIDADEDGSEEPTPGGRKLTSIGGGRTTSSLRVINRRLLSDGGFMSNFRGALCAAFLSVMTSIVTNILVASFHDIGGLFGGLFASLMLVQYSTAWVHIVMSQQSTKAFWHRLPPFKRTFDATWQPVVLYWAATEVARWLPYFLGAMIGVDWPKFNPGGPDNLYAFRQSLAQGHPAFYHKVAFIAVVSIIVPAFLIIPAKVILVRIQASLLPVEDNPIVPFDRSFQGKVEPTVVDGRGYATISDAWSTLSMTGWRRIIILNLKIVFVTLAVIVMATAVIIPEWLILVKRSIEVNDWDKMKTDSIY